MTTKQTAENTQNPKRSKKHTRNNIQICTTIDPDDLTVIKKKGISVAELLRRAVNELILTDENKCADGYIPQNILHPSNGFFLFFLLIVYCLRGVAGSRAQPKTLRNPTLQQGKSRWRDFSGVNER